MPAMWKMFNCVASICMPRWGMAGVRVYDVADVDVKDVSQRVITAPVSPLGQRFYLKTKDAAAIASPSTLALDPLRKQIPENEEQGIAPLYAFLYVADREEGLVVVGDPKTGVGTLLDGDPQNNFLKRGATFNPDGKLTGAHRITIAGTYAYILCNRGLEVVALADPLHPKIVAEIGAPVLDDPRGVAIQFSYAFIVDRAGLKVFDVTHLDQSCARWRRRRWRSTMRAMFMWRAPMRMFPPARMGLRLSTWRSRSNRSWRRCSMPGGALNDVRDLKIGMVSSEQFAFVADGKNGMRVVELFGPKTQPNFYGFSPEPAPKLIATRKMRGEALIVSKGVDRDRAVDEDGNQLSVFGRRGARPFNHEEAQRLYLRNGELYTVTNAPPGPASEMAPLAKTFRRRLNRSRLRKGYRREQGASRGLLCAKEWKLARDYCSGLVLSLTRPPHVWASREIFHKCVLGQVSQRCGGNRVD